MATPMPATSRRVERATSAPRGCAMHRTCTICQLAFVQEGRGAPRKYCDECRPGKGGSLKSWYEEHREHVRPYQHRRSEAITRDRGREIVCTHCFRTVRVQRPGDLCRSCRTYLPKWKPDPICRSCGSTFKRKGGTDAFCHRDDLCKPVRLGGSENPARKKARDEGDQIIRLAVFTRDRWRCHLCGEKVDKRLRWPDPMSASLDHVRPICRGGSHTYFNVRLAHLTCNVRKGKGKTA